MGTQKHPLSPTALADAVTASGLTAQLFYQACGIDKTTFYDIKRDHTATLETLERINKFLVLKDIMPIVPSDAPPIDIDTVIVPTRQRGHHVEMVPSGFIDHALQTLGISNQELARLGGISANSLDNWKRKGVCPLSFRATVNGLLAEHAAGGTRQLGSVPEKKEKKRYVNGRFALLVEESDMSAAVSLLAIHGIRVTVTKE